MNNFFLGGRAIFSFRVKGIKKYFIFGLGLSKQGRPRSDCAQRSSLIRIYTVCQSVCIFWTLPYGRAILVKFKDNYCYVSGAQNWQLCRYFTVVSFICIFSQQNHSESRLEMTSFRRGWMIDLTTD